MYLIQYFPVDVTVPSTVVINGDAPCNMARGFQRFLLIVADKPCY
jgi:hypothetical protein